MCQASMENPTLESGGAEASPLLEEHGSCCQPFASAQCRSGFLSQPVSSYKADSFASGIQPVQPGQLLPKTQEHQVAQQGFHLQELTPEGKVQSRNLRDRR